MGSRQDGLHVIRLRGPWEVAAGRVKLPVDWAAALGESSQATLTRRFNRPSGLGHAAKVLLRVASPHSIAAVRLNEAPLVLSDQLADVTLLLRDANLLAIDLVRGDANPVSLLDVQLEIAVS